VNALADSITRLGAWARDWAAVSFQPRQTFRAARATGLTPFQFVLGAEVLSYAACLLASNAFFLFYFWPQHFPHRWPQLQHIRATSVDSILRTSKLFGAVTIASVAMLLVSTILLYAVARLLGSTADVTAHFAAYSRLAALDPLAIAGATLVILSHAKSWPAYVGTGLFVVARAWMFLAGTYAAASVHPLQPAIRARFLALGCMLLLLVFNVLIVACSVFLTMVSLT
jgi:hypothetical protein